MDNTSSQKAFILRIAPGGVDKVPEALAEDRISIGWSEAKGLLNERLKWVGFRKIVSKIYYPNENNLRPAGAATGYLWRFIKEMKSGDLVIVPNNKIFFVAEIIDKKASYDPSKIAEGTAYYRKVKWLNDKNGIKRYNARAALQSRLKSYGTCVDATDLLEEIYDCLYCAFRGMTPSFYTDIETSLIDTTLKELQEGRLEPYEFERLIKKILLGLGAANEPKIIPRRIDYGADIITVFRVASIIDLKVAVQVKHYKSYQKIRSDVIEQLIRGIEAEEADLGMVITSGFFSDEAIKAAEKHYEDNRVKIELVDGNQLARLIVENGLNLIGLKEYGGAGAGEVLP